MNGKMTEEEVVLIDLFEPGYPIDHNYTKESLIHALNITEKNYITNIPYIYFMCFQESNVTNKTSDTLPFAAKPHSEVLKNGFKIVSDSNMAAVLYSIKQELDALDVSSVLLVLPQHRKIQIDIFLENLFTAVYRFRFELFEIHCHTDNTSDPLNKQTTSNGFTYDDVKELVSKDIQMHMESLPSLKGKLVILKSDLIPECIFLHGFTTRTGGISYIPNLSSLNLYSSHRRRDPKSVVAENFRRLGKVAGFDPKTYFSIKVEQANKVWIMGKSQPESFDGIVTNQKGITIAVPGADCIPVLFCDPVRKVCGAAHSGWKGTLLGVSMATVNAMVSEYGCNIKDILVVLGPSVGPCCLTLTQQEASAFFDIDPQCVRQFESSNPYVDIRRATRILLERGGIKHENIQDETVADMSKNLTLCTSCNPDKFFSYVRDGINLGVQIGFISIRE